MQIHFDAMFGAVTGGREIVADLAQFNAAGIACAIDFGLLDSLRELLHEVHCQLESLQPYFMCVFNRWLTRIVADSATEFMLIVAGENHAVVACRKQGAWLALRSVRYTDPSQLPILIGRERLLQGMNDNTRVYLHSPQPMPEVGLNTFATVLETPAPLPLREMAANMMLCGGD